MEELTTEQYKLIELNLLKKFDGFCKEGNEFVVVCVLVGRDNGFCNHISPSVNHADFGGLTADINAYDIVLCVFHTINSFYFNNLDNSLRRALLPVILVDETSPLAISTVEGRVFTL